MKELNGSKPDNVLNHHGPRAIGDENDPSGGEVTIVIITLLLRVHHQWMDLHLSSPFK